MVRVLISATFCMKALIRRLRLFWSKFATVRRLFWDPNVIRENKVMSKLRSSRQRKILDTLGFNELNVDLKMASVCYQLKCTFRPSKPVLLNVIERNHFWKTLVKGLWWTMAAERQKTNLRCFSGACFTNFRVAPIHRVDIRYLV